MGRRTYQVLLDRHAWGIADGGRLQRPPLRSRRARPAARQVDGGGCAEILMPQPRRTSDLLFLGPSAYQGRPRFRSTVRLSTAADEERFRRQCLLSLFQGASSTHQPHNAVQHSGARMKRSLFDLLINNRYSRPIRMKLERRALGFRITRRVVNNFYNTCRPNGRKGLFQRSAKIFRDHDAILGPGIWRIDVPPFRLKMPLRPDRAWLDWDSALAILGHDQEVKEFYSKIIGSRHRPDLFCDIGANYGTHSALFLSAGIPCIAYEPNPACVEYFEALRELNAFRDVRWKAVALGDRDGQAILRFPEKDTWHGAIDCDAQHRTQGELELIVPIRRLDGDLPSGTRCVVKIDVEGSELRVLRGGQRFFKERCTFFVFESNGAEQRSALYDEIAALDFTIEELPILDVEKSEPLERSSFVSAKGTNFLARNGMLLAGLRSVDQTQC
jgi:FkbM family methyltransferase